MSATPRLRLDGIRKSFGATQALAGVSLEVAAGEVHALIGENGAGKSTLLKILSGAHAPDAGTAVLDGRPYRPSGPADALRCGVAMIYQELSLAPHLSVRENILLGAEPAHLGWVDAAASRRRAQGALASLGYPLLPLERPAGDFPIAEQQVIEVARALLTRPRLLIMDEPTSSLTRTDTEKLFALIGRLQTQGVSILYVSHFLEECRRVCDRYTVLKDGESVASGAMAQADVDRLVTAMTGRPASTLYPPRAGIPGAPVLKANALARAPRLRRASLSVRAGEVYGIAGLVGAGRTDLLRTLFGLEPADAGEIAIFEGPTGWEPPRRRWNAGVGFLSENRKAEGLFLNRSIEDNLTMTKLPVLGRLGWVSGKRQRAAGRTWISGFAIRCRGGGQPVGELSGGNQQKVALARLLEHPAHVLLLDEPTRGIDVASKAQIYAVIARLAAEGRAILLASSYLPELLGICDTIAVMRRGELVAAKPAAEWTEAELLRSAVGGD